MKKIFRNTIYYLDGLHSFICVRSQDESLIISDAPRGSLVDYKRNLFGKEVHNKFFSEISYNDFLSFLHGQPLKRKTTTSITLSNYLVKLKNLRDNLLSFFDKANFESYYREFQDVMSDIYSKIRSFRDFILENELFLCKEIYEPYLSNKPLQLISSSFSMIDFQDFKEYIHDVLKVPGDANKNNQLYNMFIMYIISKEQEGLLEDNNNLVKKIFDLSLEYFEYFRTI